MCMEKMKTFGVGGIVWRTLDKIAALSKRNASPEALLVTAHLFSRDMYLPQDSLDDQEENKVDWTPATVLFRPESLCAWDVDTCSSSLFMHRAFELLSMDWKLSPYWNVPKKGKKFVKMLQRGLASPLVPSEVKAILIRWDVDAYRSWASGGNAHIPLRGDQMPGLGSVPTISPEDVKKMEEIDRFLTFASDSPPVSSLLPAGDPTLEGIVKTDGIFRGSRNLAALVSRRLTRLVVLWLCCHECLNTLAYVVESRPKEDLPMSLVSLIESVFRNSGHTIERSDRTKAQDKFRMFLRAVERRAPGLLANHTDARGHTLPWAMLGLAVQLPKCDRFVVFDRSKILREFGCLTQKATLDGVSWDCMENELARSELQ